MSTKIYLYFLRIHQVQKKLELSVPIISKKMYSFIDRYIFMIKNMANEKLDSQGDRIRYTRNMCGLKRKEFVEKYNLSLATVRSWELNISQISERLCKQLVEIFANESIIVTKEWIMSSIPPLPFKVSSENSDKEIKYITTIKKEIDLFLNITDKRHVFHSRNNYVTSVIEKGDILGLEEVSYNDLCKIKKCMILVGDPKQSDSSLMLTALDEKNCLVASNLSFSDCANNKVIHLDKESNYYIVSWIRKINNL